MNEFPSIRKLDQTILSAENGHGLFGQSQIWEKFHALLPDVLAHCIYTRSIYN